MNQYLLNNISRKYYLEAFFAFLTNLFMEEYISMLGLGLKDAIHLNSHE